jgi:phosphate transport system substrate-binding protein
MSMSIARNLRVLAVWASAMTLRGTSAAQGLLRGAGSTMSANYVEASRPAYQARYGMNLQYDAVGSGEGIRRVARGSVGLR